MTDTASPIELTKSLAAQFRTGPTASLTQATQWQWYEVAWVLLIGAWFGTTGRPTDLLVAGALALVWVVGPAIGVVIGGHLAIVALDVVPTAGWPFAVTEFLLVFPLLIELTTLAADRRHSAQVAAVLALFIATATAGIWVSWPLTQLIATVAGVYLVAIGTLYIQSRRSHSNSPSPTQEPSQADFEHTSDTSPEAAELNPSQ